jgi:hypothetical protein
MKPSHLFLFGVLTLALSTAGAAGKPVFDLVSLANDGSLPINHYNGDQSKITPDGRFVVFRSSEPRLVSPATSGNQIFLRDRKNGTTELISANDQGQHGNASSESATISNDGCRIAFKSDSTNLVANYSYRNSDVYVRDRCTTPKITLLASLNPSGAQSNAASFTPYISGNGRYVAFNSYSTDLVAGVTQNDLLYLRDLERKTTVLLSRRLKDGMGVSAVNPAVSDDGSRVAFWSSSLELVADALPTRENVFLYDANAVPPIRLVSSDANGIPQNLAAGFYPAISADGKYVSFYSNAGNLVPGDANNQYDIFVKHVDTNQIWRANVSSTGQEANDETRFSSALSGDGTWVTFFATASNLVSAANSSRSVFLHNIHTGETRQIPANQPEFYPSISGDLYGRFVSNFWAAELDSRYNSVGVFAYDRHQLPVAVAGIDSATVKPIAAGATVTLDGSSSHNNANVSATNNFFAPKSAPALTYTWTQTEGTAVFLSNPHAAKPSFSMPAAGRYTFRLVVSDSVEDSEPVSVTLLARVGGQATGFFALSVGKSGSGGAIVSTTPGVNCGTSCSANFAEGATVNLIATPDVGISFSGWSGDCSGTGACILNMNASKVVIASFKPASFAVSTQGVTAGVITSAVASLTNTVVFNPADTGKTGSVFVTAVAPANVLGTRAVAGSSSRSRAAVAPQSGVSTPGTLVLIQLTATGWQPVTNGQLIPYATGVLGDQLAAQTLLTNTNTSSLAGAQFCVGYGTSASEMSSAGRMQLIATVPDASAQNSASLSCLVTDSLLVQKGWNLLGNSTTQGFSVDSYYRDPTWVTSVWKWDTTQKRWQFYAPSMDTVTLNGYATANNYGVLSDIKPGEGYWINATNPTSVMIQTGTAFNLPGSSVATGWNLVATATSASPPAFNAGLSTSLTSLWAWDNPSQNFYFYAPSLVLQGGTALTDYLIATGLLDFTSNSKTLGPGVGFWVNMP